MKTMQEKLAALRYCLAEEAYEDAAGHLCDLLEHCRVNIHPSSGKPFKNLPQMVKYYGKNPEPPKGTRP